MDTGRWADVHIYYLVRKTHSQNKKKSELKIYDVRRSCTDHVIPDTEKLDKV